MMDEPNGKKNGRTPAKPGLKPPWQPGESGNPRGRKPGTGDITNRLNYLLQERIKVRGEADTKKAIEVILRSLIKKAMQGDVSAARCILDRVEPVIRDSQNVFVDARCSVIAPGVGKAWLDAIEIRAKRVPSLTNDDGHDPNAAD